MTPTDAISPRIRAAIREQEEGNEILISWIQTGLVALLSTFYFVSPKGFQMSVPFEPVPAVLAAYGPFVLVRLVLALRRKLGPFVLALSVLMDVAMLMTLIWSFHLQYGQPAAFYLKAPTFAYVFIFIALRTLRYDARYLLLAGGAAMVGWLALLGYALGPGDGKVTRSFVRYVMGYDVLVGAEIDKTLSIALVTAVLAVGVVRSRRLLAMAAYETQARRDLSRFFSPDVAARIVSSERPIRPGEGELRNAVTLMMDIRGFTKFAATAEPSTVMSLLADYQKRMVAEIFRNGGTIDKFMGDGILAHFGAAAPSDSSAADAMRAIEALLPAAEAWRTDVERRGLPRMGFGIGCASGETIFGAVGDDERLEYTVIGDAVNLAAKLEKHTKTMGAPAVTTRETAELARRQGWTPAGACRQLAASVVEGVARPIDLVAFGMGETPSASLEKRLNGERA